ncbi:hypothetical protein [Paenibacillus cremeus]|uniref:Uncharacterized protein n=1 Tax=Paenibacillus cremeus TaxID=2163881 RepID=A0A559KCZ7_9BACL|nr:hypothetical protein [Paenibacillus cremeus]TVY09993.1 hypothetical protein FPZ49_11520 [Paenibacillus cremeus]
MPNNEMSNIEERLTRLETKFELVFQTFTDAINRLETKLDKRDDTFVTKDYFNGEMRLRDEKINGLQTALDQVRQEKKETKSAWPIWLQTIGTLGAMFVAIMALYASK